MKTIVQSDCIKKPYFNAWWKHEFKTLEFPEK